MSHVGIKHTICLCEGVSIMAIIYISKGRCSLEQFPQYAFFWENHHLMLMLCKWVDCVYSVGPVNAELDIVTLHNSRASGNLLKWAATGWGGASAQWPAALFNVRGIVLRAECSSSSSSSNSKALHYSAV